MDKDDDDDDDGDGDSGDDDDDDDDDDDGGTAGCQVVVAAVSCLHPSCRCSNFMCVLLL